jgi:succinoglycan biosynthesis protein ExoM
MPRVFGRSLTLNFFFAHIIYLVFNINFIGATSDMTIRISVCICTYRRRGVTDTVRSLLAQQGVSTFEIEIIVADDDPMCSAREDILNMAQTSAFPIRYVESAARNIAACRNVCLRKSKGEWIAFIDDDQLVARDWLKEMMSTAIEYDADAVKSTVRAIYPPGILDWVRAGDPYSSDYGKTGARVRFAATGGVLFRRDLPDAKGLTFDVSLGKTGGEDSEFFRRYKMLGGKIVSCQKAVANELVSSERVSPKYLSRKFRRQGQIDGRVRYSKESLLRQSIWIIKSVIGVAIAWPYPIVRIFNGAAACWMFMKFWYYFGVLEWTLVRNTFAHE